MEYPARGERPITPVLPLSGPAAVLVYGLDGMCRALCLDLDVTGGDVVETTDEADRLQQWLVECGARVVTDISPTGGRHIYVPLAERLSFASARELVEALGMLFSSLDPGPHRSVRSGCIRTPGSLHKSGGYQELTMSLSAAYDVLRRPNGPDVVEAMRVRLRPQIAAWRARATPPPALEPASGRDPGIDVDVDLDFPAQPAGGTGQVGGAVLRIATEGAYDQRRYPSASEARAAVMSAAARAAWNLRDVVARIEDGRWAGLAALYAHKGAGERRRLITRDWRAAVALVARTQKTSPQIKGDKAQREDTVRKSNTSVRKSRGGGSPPAPPAVDLATEHGFVRTWRAALRTSEQRAFPGRSGYSVRFVLRALGGFAHATGSRYVAVGTRSLAVAAGMDHSTVSVALKAAIAAGWCDLLQAGRGEHADLYALTIPVDLAERAHVLRWDAGKLHGLRPAFRALGHVPALVFETIETGRARSVLEASRVTGISRSAVHEAVEAMVAWCLLSRNDNGALVAHPDQLPAAAEHLGALDAVAAQIRTYARHRIAWRAYLTRHDLDAEPTDIYGPDPDDLAWLDATDWWLPPDGSHEPGWTMTDVVTTVHDAA